MADEDLLSKDEIDALLSGVDNGDVNLGDGGGLYQDCTEYDLTSKEHITRASLPGLDAINERFARQFRASAYAALRKPADVEIKSRVIKSFQEFAGSVVRPSSLTVLKAPPLRGSALVAISPQLVNRVVDTFFGGNGRNFASSDERDYTLTEVRVIKIITDALLGDLTESWNQLVPLTFEATSHESNIQMAQITGANEPVIISEFSVKTDQGGGEFWVIYPFGLIEPIRHRLEDAGSGESDRDEQWSQLLRDQVANAHAQVRCKLSTVEMSLRRVLQLRVGDVIPIDEPDQVQVDIEGVPCIRGRLGVSRQNLAISVEQFFNLHEASEHAPARSVALLNEIKTKRLQ
ncbi:MAG: flagellar motor switch protein FliM [Gammaproteobacteria bacterium]|nr:flagellar motor switch protein FliM [Gammaproteobacteria bacterium]